MWHCKKRPISDFLLSGLEKTLRVLPFIAVRVWKRRRRKGGLAWLLIICGEYCPSWMNLQIFVIQVQFPIDCMGHLILDVLLREINRAERNLDFLTTSYNYLTWILPVSIGVKNHYATSVF